MKTILFFVVILLANIIQGITGFAGTILAMPPGIFLVGYECAKPVLNVLGLLSGIYVFLGNRKDVCWTELKKVLSIMAIGIAGGIFLKSYVIGREEYLYKLLGIFVVILGIAGFYKMIRVELNGKKENRVVSFSLLILSGIVHGMFVSGGPLLINYLSKKVGSKAGFRATISTVWIILNSIILVDDFRSGLLTPSVGQLLLPSAPMLLLGLYLGNKLYAKMSQNLFVRSTYVLLIISGITLMIK